ncbi:MFS transporter [Ornithinibacillus sp. 4-3]|uniref:MFS transporter n=1 Tax=Ornithinibacillus sp. 4-3 TaxID=3231488 RepID=A0AB39HLM5_9BACI
MKSGVVINVGNGQAHNKFKIHSAWWILLGLCIIVGLGKGTLNNSAGLFLPPISNELGIGMGDLTLYFSISAIITMLYLPFSGRMLEKYNIRFILIISIICEAGAYIAFSFMNAVWGWYLFAVPLAFGGVFITVIAGPVLISQWFKRNNGLALGILTATGGLFGAISQPIVGNIIVHQGWRFAYVAIGLTAIVIAVPIILLFIKKVNPAKGLYPYCLTESEQNRQEANENIQNTGVSMAVAKKNSAFYALMIFLFFLTSISSFSIHIPRYLIDSGYEQTFAGNAMGIYMLGVVLGAIVIGLINDKFGSKNATILSMVSGIISVSLLLFASSSAIVIYIALILFAFVTSGIGTLGPSLALSLFGIKEYSRIYSTASLGLATAAIVALPAYGYIFQFTGSYSGGLYTILIMLVINIFAVIFAFRGKTKLEKSGLWS